MLTCLTVEANLPGRKFTSTVSRQWQFIENTLYIARISLTRLVSCLEYNIFVVRVRKSEITLFISQPRLLPYLFDGYLFVWLNAPLTFVMFYTYF